MRALFMNVLYPLRVLHGKLHYAFLPYKEFVKSCFPKKRLENEKYPIDFVVTWVNGNDPLWREKRDKYISYQQNMDGKGEERYRDWDLFHYWFRAVELYASWVNKVYLVTDAQTPSFINVSCPKLQIVDHREIIQERYLPVFNCNAIEMCLWKIPGLSEHFVYFNDDVFMNHPSSPEDFFTEGLPNYCALATTRCSHIEKSYYQYILYRIESIVNTHFYLKNCIEKTPQKWFNYKYGKAVKYNRRAYADGFLTGMEYSHLGLPYRKSTFEQIWDEIPEYVDETCSHRFRSPFDISHQIAMLWEICNGSFEPVSQTHYGKFHSLRREFISDVQNDIRNAEKLMLCINDNEYVQHEDFLQMKQQLHDAFEEKLPHKSSFER